MTKSMTHATWLAPGDLDICMVSEKTIVNAKRVATRSEVARSKRLRLRRGLTMHSGPANNVMPRRMARGKGMGIRPSPGSKRGIHYLAANNARIKNEGECDFPFTADDGQDASFVMQIAEVNKALCAISYMVDHSYRVVSDRDDKTGVDLSHMCNKVTGKSLKLRRDRNVWVLDATIEMEPDEKSNNDSHFARQG